MATRFFDALHQLALILRRYTVSYHSCMEDLYSLEEWATVFIVMNRDNTKVAERDLKCLYVWRCFM